MVHFGSRHKASPVVSSNYIFSSALSTASVIGLRETEFMSFECSVDLAFLCCPYMDHGDLRQVSDDEIVCKLCDRHFRVVAGHPILIDESRSIFSSEEVALSGDVRQFPNDSGWRYQIRSVLPAAASRDVSLPLLEKHRALLPDDPTVLIIGCGMGADQYRKLFPTGQIFPTDVTFQGDAVVACDGACLPFRDQTLDCVVVDQVIEHALNPAAIVSEIHRCLKVGGIVYSGVPFHTPVHGFPFDFQRYTPLGHRMLFGRFQGLEVCITQGPVSALSKTVIGFFSSVSKNLWWGRFTSAGVRLLVSPMLWLDLRYTSAKELSIPAASAFLGRKQESEESPRTLISNWSHGHRESVG
jgi:SAM-dependent methyltransferase